MTELVVEVDLGVRWEPNAPASVLIVGDDGSAALAMRAHFDDDDVRCVVLRWSDVCWTSMGGPNDEALRVHRLYGKGLENVHWAGRVESSDLTRTIASMVHDGSGLTRYVVLLKECVVEVVARAVSARRVGGDTLEAARRALA